jgi:hypothetical protein
LAAAAEAVASAAAAGNLIKTEQLANNNFKPLKMAKKKLFQLLKQEEEEVVNDDEDMTIIVPAASGSQTISLITQGKTGIRGGSCNPSYWHGRSEFEDSSLDLGKIILKVISDQIKIILSKKDIKSNQIKSNQDHSVF